MNKAIPALLVVAKRGTRAPKVIPDQKGLPDIPAKVLLAIPGQRAIQDYKARPGIPVLAEPRDILGQRELLATQG